MAARAGIGVAVLALALVACGGGKSTDASASRATTTATTPGASSTASTLLTSTTKSHPKVTLPPGGPKGPVDPPGTPAYELLTAGGSSCRQLLTAVNAWPRTSASDPSVNGVEDRLFFLYRAAAEACLQQWSDASADFAKLQALKPAPTFGTTCSSDSERYCERCHRLVFDWLMSQLAAYRNDTTYAPDIAPSTASSPCPTEPPSTTSTTTTPISTTKAPGTTTTKKP